MNSLGDLLFDVSSAMLWPTVAALLALLAIALMSLGECLREVLARRADHARWRAFRDRVNSAGLEAGSVARSFFADAGWTGLLGKFAREGGRDASTQQLEPVLAACEIEAGRRIGRANLIARAGPILGLMATLILMGPVLMALSDGDLLTLAQNLKVKFSTTVVGLFIGLIQTTIATVRRHAYADDLARLEFVIASLAERREGRAA